MNYKKIQEDLRNGMSITDCCRKYNISFQDLCDRMPKRQKPKTKSNRFTGEKYIQTRDGKYYLRKSVNKKTRMFGTYNSLEDAIKVRDHCIEHGWIQKNIDQYCRELGIKRYTDKKCRVRYH